ncbi:efflux RND transporter permease subunit [Cyanothece sp. BG0011]|uniref:efflux RND transporter permease subunit n=1 Tax=Cyanothece sp. BG0011 TaxID=2082950 RepID=UPI000D1E173E|nr:efflux RND transporter permease subunit [Cyanothece sp. BG0011]
MSFHLSTWSIKNPIPVLVVFLTITLIGLVSFTNLGIDNEPNIDVPVVSINITQRGASPTELETQVTQKIEDAVAGLGNIEEILSTVTDENSNTIINFVLGTDANQASNDVQNAVNGIRQDLPQDIDEPIVKRVDFAGGAILTYGVASQQRSVEELSDLVDRDIARALLNIEGVGQVNRLGGVDREIRVDLEPDALLAYGITATEVNEQIRNFNLNLPGGRSQIGGQEQNIRTLGSVQSISALKDYPIILSNGDRIALDSLGEIQDSYADPRQSAYLNGQPVVGFSVVRSTGSTLVTVEEQVRQVVQALEQTLADDIQFTLIFTLGDYIRSTYKGTFDALMLGCLLTVIVVGLFLKDWRATLITSIALPLSLIPTFAVMGLLNYTLNSMTLLALALAIGNLVDDAICMIENIDSHLQRGKDPLQAAWDGSVEIGLAVVATTATIVGVFMPLGFMGGIPGQYFQPFGVTVSVATLFSTLVATTIIPLLCSRLLQSKPRKKNNNNLEPQQFYPLNLYRRLLIWSLRHPMVTLLLAIVFFIASLQLVPFIPKGLFNAGDTGLSRVSVELPPGSTLQDTEEVVQQATAMMQPHPAVAQILSHVGDDGQVNEALMYIKLLPKDERNISEQGFKEEIRPQLSAIPGARVTFRSEGAVSGSKDLSIILKSSNPMALTTTAKTLEQQMAQIPGLVEVTSSLSLVKPEIIVEPDPQRATDLGVSVQAIAQTTSLAFLGDVNFNLAKFNLPDRQIPIRVKVASEQQQDINTLKNLRVPRDDGTLVPLNAVATLRYGSGPAQIRRFNRYRQVELSGNLQGISLGDALDQIRALPAMNPLPPEVSEEPFGDAKIMKDIFSRFLGALSLSILCIYVILVLLYSNFLYPLTIMMSLPLSIGGALLGLLLTQKELGLFALIGIVLLMGLVTKNAILLVDFALAAMEKNQPKFKALVGAGLCRLRPISMTTLSTIAGMLPIALAWGADGEVRSPMAIAVIGGLCTSTLLTLIVIPVIFSYMADLMTFNKKINRSLKMKLKQ